MEMRPYTPSLSQSDKPLEIASIIQARGKKKKKKKKKSRAARPQDYRRRIRVGPAASPLPSPRVYTVVPVGLFTRVETSTRCARCARDSRDRADGISTRTRKNIL